LLEILEFSGDGCASSGSLDVPNNKSFFVASGSQLYTLLTSAAHVEAIKGIN